MANEIISRTVRSETKKRLSIEGSYIDSLIVGGSWTKIRIGMRFSVTRNANVTSPPSIYFGLASSSGNVVGQPTPKHFLGVKTNATNWSFSSLTGGDGDAFGCGLSTSLIVNGIESANNIGTQGGNTASVPALACSISNDGGEAVGLLYGFFVEITKGSPNYNVAVWSVAFNNSTNRPLRNITDQKFKDYMDASTPPTGQNQLLAIGNTNYAVDEITNGTLDTVNVCWQGSAFPIEIANIGVKVLA